MKIPLAFIFIFVLNPLHLQCQVDPDDASKVIELNNGAIVREIRFEQGALSSSGLYKAGSERN